MPPEDEDELPLEVYWDALRGRREPVHTAPLFKDLAEANDMVIGTSANRILVIIKPTGELLFGPEYSPQEASMIFWESMGQRRLQMEDRLLMVQHMEAVLVRLGRADLECERFRREALEETEPRLKAEKEQRAEISIRTLNMVAHQAIELGRGLARRPEVIPPIVPERIPDSFRQNPNHEYQGREGLPPEPPEENDPPG